MYVTGTISPLGAAEGCGPATYDQAVPVVLSSRARPKLSVVPDVDEHEPIEHEPIELIGSGDTYEDAKTDLESQLPQGWVLLGIGRVDDE